VTEAYDKLVLVLSLPHLALCTCILDVLIGWTPEHSSAAKRLQYGVHA